MTPTRKPAAVLLAILAGAAAIVFSLHAQPQGQVPMPAQQPTAPVSNLNHNLILLDPAHGGPESGATLGDHILEKDLTLAISARLRTALAAAGFTVVSTRDADPADPLTTDARAEIANRTHAVACIVLHATATGSGVHLYTSTLQPADPDDDSPSDFTPIPWEMAQAAFVTQSQRLSADLAAAFTKGNLPVLAGHAAVRPLDNLMCPAVVLEIAPLRSPGEDPTAVTDADYQQRVIAALATTLQAWRDHADPAATAPENSAQSRAIAAANAAGLAATRARTPASPPAQQGAQ